MQGSTVSPIHIGCSGWVYKHWRGILYPEGLPQTRWFQRYAEEFDTVEINASFYRVPRPETFDGWRDKAPEGFRYAVKVNRFITHLKKLVGVEHTLAEFAALARRLGPTLGPLLYQLPPSLKLDLDRLETFLKLIPKDLANVFEFRSKDWYVPETYALLDRYGASFCVHDMPGSKTERIAVGPIAYSASTAAKANIGAAIPTKACSAGPTGSWTNHARAAPSGAISTTTSTAMPSTTRRRSNAWSGK